MRDYLLDLVGHTLDLGCIDLVKITGTDKETVIDGMAEDRSVVVQGRFQAPVADHSDQARSQRTERASWPTLQECRCRFPKRLSFYDFRDHSRKTQDSEIQRF